MSTTITTTDIITQWGNQYKNEGQTAADIYKIRNYSFDYQNEFTRRVTDSTVVDIVESQFTNVLQAFQKGYTPNGDVTFTPHQVKLFNVKVDTLFTPDDLKDSYVGFLASDSTLDRAQWPFVRWFMQFHLRPMLEQNFELEAAYNGIYAAPVPGTAGTPAASMDGIKKIIEDYITASVITPIVTGALSTTPVTLVEQLEDFVKSIDIRYRNMPMTLLMNQTHYQNFKEGMDTKYNTQYLGQNVLTALRYFPNIMVKGSNAMTGSDRVYCTFNGNANMWTKGVNMFNQWKIENVDRQVKIYTDGYIGLNFIQPSLVFCNDQA